METHLEALQHSQQPFASSCLQAQGPCDAMCLHHAPSSVLQSAPLSKQACNGSTLCCTQTVEHAIALDCLELSFASAEG